MIFGTRLRQGSEKSNTNLSATVLIDRPKLFTTFRHQANNKECMVLEKKFNEIWKLKKRSQSEIEKVVHTV